jgi:hypothetical protein
LKEDVAVDDEESEGDKKKSEEPKIKIEILDSEGGLIREVEGPAKAGTHRIAWDLRREPIPKPEDEKAFRFQMSAPQVHPGQYTVKWKVGDKELTRPVDVRLHASLEVDESHLRAQYDALMTLQGMGKRGAEMVRSIDDIKPQLESIIQRLGKMEEIPEDLVENAKQIVEKLEELRDEMARPSDESYRGGGKLLDKIRGLAGSIGAATAAPTVAQNEWLAAFSAELEDVVGRFKVVIEQDILALSQDMDAAGIPRVFH